MSKQVSKNLLQLSQEETKQFVDSFDLVLADCDGVVWTLTGGLPGVKEGIQVLQTLNKSLAFVSNNSVSNQAKYETKFSALGVNFNYEEQLVHPADSFVRYFNSIGFDKQKTIYLIGGPVHRQLLERNGYKYVTAPDVYNVEDVVSFYKNIFADIPVEDVAAVCMDVDLDLNMGKFFAAEYLLNKNPDCLLLVGGTDAEYTIYDYSFVGMGHWVDSLLKRCRQQPIGVGKPGNALCELMMEKYAIKDPNRVLFIGDTLEQDIGFAKKNGFKTLLVLSGATTKEMLNGKVKEEELPDYVTESLFDFVQLRENLNV